MGLVDKVLIAHKFATSADTYRQAATAQRQIIQKLLELYRSFAPKTLGKALEVGCGDASFAQAIHACYPAEEWTLNDIQANMLGQGADILEPKTAIRLVIGDAETIDLGKGYDLILSSSALQWFHRPRTFVHSLLERLSPTGLLLLSSFGVDNLQEVKRLTQRGLNYPSLSEFGDWFEGYEILALAEEHITLDFPSPRDVLLHLKHTGVTATAGEESLWTPRRYAHFCAEYQRLFSTQDGSLSLTYHPIYIVASPKG